MTGAWLPSEGIDWAERWLQDGLDVSRMSQGFATLEVDMTRTLDLVKRLRGATGEKITPLHVIARASALVLEKNPRANAMLGRRRRERPSGVDVGVSVAETDMNYAPVVVVEGAHGKGIVTIARELERKVREQREKTQRDLARCVAGAG